MYGFEIRHNIAIFSIVLYRLNALYGNEFCAPIGAWKCNFPAFFGNNDRPMIDRDGTTCQPTNQQTEMSVHKEVTHPIMFFT